MKYIIKTSIAAILLIGIFGFESNTPKAPASVVKEDLKGVWELISYKYGTETSFSGVPSFVKYKKFISEDNFHWVSYGENGDDVIGAGGGKFKLQNGKYIETIEFFHPVGTGLIGNSTSFNFTLNGDTWAIEGYIKSIKLEPETGRTLAIDSIKLSEVWQRIE